MADQDSTEGEREMEEAQVEEEEDNLLLFSRYAEERATIPWEQRSFREKVGHHLDRIFIAFLIIFFIILIAEAAYKLWYITNFQKLWQLAANLFSYFLKQEEGEELLEL